MKTTGRTTGGRMTTGRMTARISGGGRTGRERASRATGLCLALLAGCMGDAAETPPLVHAVLATEHASNPTVAGDDDGMLATWVETRGEASNVVLVRANRAGEPTETVRVNDVLGDAAAHGQAPARVAVGPEGNVYVAWQNATEIPGRMYPASDLRFARSTDGGRTFEPAIYVNDDAGGTPASHTFHDMKVLGDGAVLVSWIDGRARAGATGPDIRVARSTDGGESFGAGVILDDEACPCCRTAMATGPDGTVFVAWRKVYPGNIRDIVVARSTDGGRTFGEPQRVHEDRWVIDGCPHAGPALAVDRAGRLHVAWFTAGEAGHGLYHTTSGDGGVTFADPFRITPEGPVPTTQVTMAADPADPDGQVWLAWEDTSPGRSGVRLGRSIGGGNPETIAHDAFEGMLPSAAIVHGAPAIAWLDGDAVGLLRMDR